MVQVFDCYIVLWYMLLKPHGLSHSQGATTLQACNGDYRDEAH